MTVVRQQSGLVHIPPHCDGRGTEYGSAIYLGLLWWVVVSVSDTAGVGRKGSDRTKGTKRRESIKCKEWLKEVVDDSVK